jgi:hypothetical protein
MVLHLHPLGTKPAPKNAQVKFAQTPWVEKYGPAPVLVQNPTGLKPAGPTVIPNCVVIFPAINRFQVFALHQNHGRLITYPCLDLTSRHAVGIIQQRTFP